VIKSNNPHLADGEIYGDYFFYHLPSSSMAKLHGYARGFTTTTGAPHAQRGGQGAPNFSREAPEGHFGVAALPGAL